MNRVVRVVTLTGLMTLLAGLLAVASAAAAGPQVVHTQVNVSLTGIDQCGFTVNSVVRGRALSSRVEAATSRLSRSRATVRVSPKVCPLRRWARERHVRALEKRRTSGISVCQ
jgi:hypothetical protein